MLAAKTGARANRCDDAHVEGQRAVEGIRGRRLVATRKPRNARDDGAGGRWGGHASRHCCAEFLGSAASFKAARKGAELAGRRSRDATLAGSSATHARSV